MKGVSALLPTITFFCLAMAASGSEAASVVTSGGFFYQYAGPVGYPIYKTPLRPQRDGAVSYVSVFHDPVLGRTVRATPADPYLGYEAADFAGAGTAVVDLTAFQGTTVEFWNEANGNPEGSRNILALTGNVTSGVSIDPTTHKSDLFKLATLSFTNGSWFSVSGSASPPYDPGLGPLYPESYFAFSLTARPDPFIGQSGFPGYHVVNDKLVLQSTFGAGTPDHLYISGNPQLGAIAVDEGVTGSVELWGRIGSLELAEFRNPTAGVALIPPSSVPAPPTLWLLGTGLLVTAGTLRGRRR